MFSKNAIPRDIDYVVHETLELIRPSFKLASGFEEALSLVNAASAANTSASGENSTSAEDVDMDTDQPQDQQQQQQQGQPDSQEQDSEDGISEEDEGEDSDEEEDDDEQEEGGDDDEDEEEGDGGDSEEGNEEEEQARIEDMEAALAEQEFERELGLIMQESIESRKNEKRPAVFDVAIPSSKTSKVGAFDRINSENGGMDVAEKSHVEFTILTKKGAKSQVNEVN